MKPIAINLVIKKNIRSNVFLGFVVMLVFTTLAVTLSNAVDYYANKKVVNTYELRLKEINRRLKQKKTFARNIDVNKKEYQKIKQDLSYLSGIIKKNMFPLPVVLSEIERIKPDKIDINELIFSENLKTLIIKGESNHVGSVSLFIVDMERSKHFDVELSKEEIKEDKKIFFELTARWVSLENDQKI